MSASTPRAVTPLPPVAALAAELRARRDRAARYWFGRAAREVSRDRGARSGERAVDVVTPGPPGRARSTLRAALRAAPAAPSSRSACGGLCLLVPRPVRQLSVGASRAVSSRPDQDPSALGRSAAEAVLVRSSPPSLPAPEQSSAPDGPGEWVAGHPGPQSLPYRCRLQFREGPQGQHRHHDSGAEQTEQLTADPAVAGDARCRREVSADSPNSQLLIALQVSRAPWEGARRDAPRRCISSRGDKRFSAAVRVGTVGHYVTSP